ncbi:MAG TPA: hypothetical protein VMN57_01220 [Anaerolineales bacterium]|nr:hypothetical protein [Anaerolineales bacterium]
MSPLSALLVPLALLALLLPGLVLERVAARGDRQAGRSIADPSARLADAYGVGFALVAVGGMLTFYLRLSVPVIWIAGLLALTAVWLVRDGITGKSAEREEPGRVLLDVAPFILLTVLLVLRFIQARELVLPAWVDSVHHTLLVRLLLENGGLPRTLEPYMPVPLYYHAGFHTNTALFAALTGLAPDRAVLIFGQILNSAVALGVYRLGRALWRDGPRALVAMLLVGFCFQMPAYYLTWGRYTLLAGVFLLTLAMSAALELVRGGVDRAGIVRLGVLTAGLFLTHYLAAALLLLFLGVLVLERVFAEKGFLRTGSFKALLAGAAGGGLCALPWLVRVLAYSTDLVGLDVVLPGESLDEAYYAGYLDYLLGLLGPLNGPRIPGTDLALPGRGLVLHGLGLAGLVLIGWRREVRPLALYALAAGLLSLPWGVNLAPFRPDHGVILAFLPASLLAADVLVSPLDPDRPRRVRGVLAGLLVAALLGLAMWGVSGTVEIVNPGTVLADAGDVAALAWIEENTPEEAVFLVNTTYWQGGAYRGVDGGWWITPQTGRATSLPPALYLSGKREYVLTLLDRARRMSAVEDCGDELRALIEETGATHVYLHQGRGSLQPASLAGCAGLRPVYAGEGVFIFEVGDDAWRGSRIPGPNKGSPTHSRLGTD